MTSDSLSISLRLSRKLVSRLYAAGTHLGLSALVALLVAGVVFTLWYPWPYRFVSGGQELFLLLITVDVVMGPCLTLVIFNTDKGWRYLRRDLAVIASLQLAALAYGLHAVYAARPVSLVFEKDRFRVISVVDVYEPELKKALPQYRHLPLTGPWLLGARAPTDEEYADALEMGFKGVDVGQRPTFWQPYEQSREEAARKARPVSMLYEKHDERSDQLDRALADQNLSRDNTLFLPMLAREDWVVLLHPNGDIAGFAPFDGW